MCIKVLTHYEVGDYMKCKVAGYSHSILTRPEVMEKVENGNWIKENNKRRIYIT